MEKEPAMWNEIKEEGNIKAKKRLKRISEENKRVETSNMCSQNEAPLSLHVQNYQGESDNKPEEEQPEILTPPSSCEDSKSPVSSGGKEAPPDLPKMFLDLLEPVQGLRPKKLEFTCTVCSLRLASHNSLITHNKTHCRPACLHCLKRFPSHSSMARHSQTCRQVTTVLVTSKYGRSRNVRCYLGLS